MSMLVRQKSSRLLRIGSHAVSVLVTLLIGACSEKSKQGDTGGSQAEVDAAFSKLISTYDESGTPIAKEGFHVDPTLAENNNQLSIEQVVSPGESDVKVFEYEAPEGISAEFSEPHMVTGASLLQVDLVKECGSLAYSTTEPTMAGILQAAKKIESCGNMQISYCIKLTAAHRQEAAYLKTPPFTFNLLCPAETLAGLGIAVAAPTSGADISQSPEGAGTTQSTSVDLTIAAGPLVSDVYVSNSPGCQEGGTWEPLTTRKKPWVLAQENAVNKVYVAFRDVLGRESACFEETIVHDNDVAGNESITLAAGQTYTQAASVSIGLSAEDASSMYITNTPGCSADGSWQAFASSLAGWPLAQNNSVATVYVKFRDDHQNESACLAASILHDDQAPAAPAITIDAGAAQALSPIVSLSLTAGEASEVFVSNTAGCASGGSWEPYVTSKAWTLGQTNALATVYAKFRDEHGNEGACVSDTITHSGVGPTAPSLVINGGQTYTTSSAVSLTLAATGASSMYLTNTAGCTTGGTWEAYATTKAWSLGQSNALANVYVKYKDSLANESACVSASITHDDQAPAATSVTINSGDSHTSNTIVSLSLAATDVQDMYITNSAGCAAGGVWEAFTVSKAWTLAQSESLATVYAKYKDDHGNESACLSASITHDSQQPSAETISIDGGQANATSTSVTLSLSAVGADEMYITNTAGCGSNGTWEPYATSKAWTLGQSNATATVYIQYRDFAGNAGSCISDTITHDDAGPTSTSISIDAGASVTTTTSVSLTLAASDASHMYVTNTAGCASDGSWEAYATSKAWTLLQSNATATVYVRYKDSLGNTSSCISDTITHDDTAPTSTSISIDAGAAYATTTAVTLTLAATGAATMYVTNTAACAGGGSWEAYATSKAWTLGQTEGTATVYVSFKDAAGNATCLSDTITHDSVAPSGEAISISSGATYTTSSSVTLGLAATGASQMYITNTAGCGSNGSWESYATTKASWALGQTNATATVYALFKDAAGNPSTCVSDTIVHDGQNPSAPASFNDGTAATSATLSPSLSWSASTDAGSGVAAYEVAIGTSAGDSDVSNWSNVGNVTSAVITGLTLIKGNQYYASVRAVDAAGNTSSVSNGDGFIYTPQWSQQAYIKAVNNSAEDSFGENIALSGNTLVVGSDLEDSSQTTITNGTTAATDNGVSGSGAIYVYKRTGTTWDQEAYIKASNSGLDDGYRASVAIDGDTLVVGTQPEDSNQTTISYGTDASTDNSNSNSGAAYIYKRTATTWAQEAFLKAVNNNANDNFGFKVSVSGDTVAVAADVEDSNQSTITNGTDASTNNTNGGSGAVYVYRRTGTTWAQEAYVKAANNNADDSFGESVSLSGDTLAVGADSEDSNETTITNGTTASTNNALSASGAAYVYKRTGTTWAQEAYLKAANANADDNYGSAIALYGNTLAVAADSEDSSQTTITNGTTASTDTSAAGSGAVYVYQRSAAIWAQQAYIKAANANSTDEFGHSVALHSDTLVVGVELEDSNETTITHGTTASANNSASDAGAVYVYRRSGASWEQEAYIKSGNAASSDWFGYKVAVYGDTLAASADGEDSNQTTITNGTGVSTNNSNLSSGAVYIFTR